MAFFEFCKKGTLHTPTHVPSILMLDPAGFSRADDLTYHAQDEALDTD